MTSIYLSCTTKDLKKHKLAVKSRLDSLRLTNRDTVFHTVAKDARPLDKCLADIEACDLYIGLFALRYGAIQATSDNPKRLAFTELEYRHARALGKDCLVFLADEDSVPFEFVEVGDDLERIQALRRELEDPAAAPTPEYFSFTDISELEAKVVSALFHHLGVDSKPALPTWPADVCPYPGIVPFDIEHHPVYFGRDTQVREAEAKLAEPGCDFLMVSGRSGSGKSSLVRAGLLPRLIDPEHEPFLYMRPGDDGVGSNPLNMLAKAIAEYLPGAPRPFELAHKWRERPAAFAEDWGRIDPRPRWLLLDQMEELFTSCPEHTQAPFLDALFAAVDAGLRVLASIRSDYKDQCETHPRLHRVLEQRHYIDLWRLSYDSILDMIRRPAEITGLDVSEIDERLADDTEERPDNLPLLAAALEDLWQRREGKRLTQAAYDALGGLRGVVGTRAEAAFTKLVEAIGVERAEAAFHEVFQRLTRVTLAGRPTRYVARLTDLADDDARKLVEIFSHHLTRLLTLDQGDDGRTVEVSHEALFDAWPKLAQWIEARRQNERELALAAGDGAEWARCGHDPVRLIPEKILDARRALETLQRGPDELDETTRDYLYPAVRFLAEIERPLAEIGHQRRARIGDLLDRFGDDERPGIGVRADGLPDFDAEYWVPFPAGTVDIKDDDNNVLASLPVDAGRIARLPVTQGQFKAFIAAEDGYRNPAWWNEFGKVPTEPFRYPDTGNNEPVVTCVWYEALAYARWLNQRLQGAPLLAGDRVIRLPTEQEWQQAASGGDPARNWPWGSGWGLGPANTMESGINRVCAAGLFPEGANVTGAMDMGGNVWEWCLNQHENPEVYSTEHSDAARVVRGGSWYVDRGFAGVAVRFRYAPDYRYAAIGFRLCVSPPIVDR